MLKLPLADGSTIHVYATTINVVHSKKDSETTTIVLEGGLTYEVQMGIQGIRGRLKKAGVEIID